MKTVIVNRTELCTRTFAVQFNDGEEDIEMMAEIKVSCGPINEVDKKERVDLIDIKYSGETTIIRPQFKHDCERCVFLGRVYSSTSEHEKEMSDFDLYYCDGGSLYETVIARFGSDGPDYMSGLNFTYIEKEHCVFPLIEAKKRAIILGLIE